MFALLDVRSRDDGKPGIQKFRADPKRFLSPLEEVTKSQLKRRRRSERSDDTASSAINMFRNCRNIRGGGKFVIQTSASGLVSNSNANQLRREPTPKPPAACLPN